MTNKVLCGYQGWHCCPGDGNDPSLGWTHWSESASTIGVGYYHTEVWPQISEYNSSDLYYVPNTNLTYGGTPYLYSDRKQGATDTHFRWMLENGIDGVFLQRFAAEQYGGAYQGHFDTVLQHVMNSAGTYGRIWCLEYDISGCTDNMVFDRLTSDWNYLNNNWNIKNHSRYLNHNGKPVIAIWGFGYPDRCGTPAIAQQVINWFKAQGCYVVGGVPGGWRTQDPGDTKQDPAWNGVFRSYDCITPWTVGGYRTATDINNFKNSKIVPDLTECNSRGIQYMATMWPRFGWDNMNHYSCGTSDISPRGGQHLWDQIYRWKQAGVQTQFLAMFDEYDESTAIMKLTDNIPTGACFWNTEGYGEDWYLRLAGQASKMQRGEIALSATIPISSGTSPDNSQFISDTIPTTMNPGQQYSVSVTMKNIGETVWSWELFKLGGVGDSDPFAPARQNLPAGTSVAPNEQYTFNFTMTAPTTAGTYTTDWRMVHDIIRWFGATDTKVVTVGGGGGGQSPYSGVIALPGTIQAENYDNGGEGVAYHDLSGGNYGGVYRTNDVDIGACSDTGGGYTVGWIDAGEWLEYTVSAASAGDYDFYVRVSSPNTGSSFKILIDGADITGTRAFASTGGWDNWTTIIVPARHLNAGQHILQFNVVTGGFNLNKIDVYNRNADAVSIDLGNPDVLDGMSHIQVGDGDTVPWTAAGHYCRENVDYPDLYMYFGVADNYAYQGNKQNIYITFDYYDLGSGTIGLNYDAVGNQWKYVAGPALTNTGGWKQYTFHVTDAYFGNRENGGADFRICGIWGEWGLDTVCVYQ
jgi:hypothetical protein